MIRDLRKDLAADAESLDGLPLDDPRVVKSRKRIARAAQRRAARVHPRVAPPVRLAVLNAPLHLLRLAGRAAVVVVGVSGWWAMHAWCWSSTLPVVMGGVG
ncbi:MAG: hypothetical protein AAFY08_12960 [Planctomycetota bacterium]